MSGDVTRLSAFHSGALDLLKPDKSLKERMLAGSSGA